LTSMFGEQAETSAVHVWGIMVFLLAIGLMWKGLYSQFEKIVIALVIIFGVTVLVSLCMLQGTEYRITGSDIATGMSFSLGEDKRRAAFAVIALMGGLGVSGIEIMVYPYWIREKGYSRFLGDPGSDGWVERARGWIRLMQLDALMATFMATILTAAFFLLGAAILFRQGIKPEGIGVVDQMSAIFTGTYVVGGLVACFFSGHSVHCFLHYFTRPVPTAESSRTSFAI